MTRTLLMKISVVAVLAAAACPVHALGPKDKARALWDRLMAPNPRLDNRKRFSYLSAYNGKMVQRRSAASWVVAARYMQGKLEVDPGDVTLRGLMVGTGSFSTLQGSLGGGFSANWVPWHRDPARPGDLRGLRNLTFNLTAMPMLAVYSRTVTRNDESFRKHVLASWMKPDFMTRAGVGFSAGHFFLNAWTDFSFHFFSNGQEEFETEDALRYTLSQGGAFSSWTAGLQLNWRF